LRALTLDGLLAAGVERLVTEPLELFELPPRRFVSRSHGEGD
jgi:hypothetical protein